MEIREEVARAICTADLREDGFSFDELWADPELYFDFADAAIAIVLRKVEQHLSAAQYDPAPYTALKHRLAELRQSKPDQKQDVRNPAVSDIAEVAKSKPDQESDYRPTPPESQHG